jgi:LysM repeat protein
MPRHVVTQGECLSSISAQYGLNWQTVWNHGENAELKAKRKNPNVLYPGDVLHVPDKELKYVSRPTGQAHRFVVSTQQTRVKIRLTVNDKPRTKVSFTLYADDEVLAQGTTDGDGFLSADIPSAIRDGRLEITEADVVDSYLLKFGNIDPIDTESGASQRLHNLGYRALDDIGAGVRSFQARMKLPVTGDIDAATRSALEDKYGL